MYLKTFNLLSRFLSPCFIPTEDVGELKGLVGLKDNGRGTDNHIIPFCLVFSSLF